MMVAVAAVAAVTTTTTTTIIIIIVVVVVAATVILFMGSHKANGDNGLSNIRQAKIKDNIYHVLLIVFFENLLLKY